MAKGRITIMIEGKVLRDIDKIARALKRSRSEVIGSAMEDFLQDQKLGLEAFTNPVVSEALMKAFGNRDVMRVLIGAMGEHIDESKLAEVEGLFQRLQDHAKLKGGK